MIKFYNINRSVKTKYWKLIKKYVNKFLKDTKILILKY